MKTIHHTSMPMEKYQASHEFISKSMLGVFDDCPAKFKYLYIDGNEKPRTKSLRLGTAIHTLALEPEKFRSEFYVLPMKDDGKEIIRNASHAAYKEQLAIAADREVLSNSEYEQIEGMANSLTRNTMAINALKGAGFIESTIMWEQDGMKFKCRPDLMKNDGLIIDLKTAKSAKPRIFMSDARSYGYDLSVALTSRGFQALHGKPAEEYIFLVIEPEVPYVVELFTSFETDENTGQSYLDSGSNRLDAIIERFKECQASKIWPNYTGGSITPMSQPAWSR